MSGDRSVETLAHDLLGRDYGKLSRSERRVLKSIHDRGIVAADTHAQEDREATFGARLADRVAAVGGSWGFIIAFALVLFGWMLLNSRVMGSLDLAFDPYPFIFLNLMLSTLAAIQAPIIMMSQNRQTEKDRAQAEQDYEVNLRAELEIMQLHRKLDRIVDDVAALRGAGAPAS